MCPVVPVLQIANVLKYLKWLAETKWQIAWKTYKPKEKAPMFIGGKKQKAENEQAAIIFMN